MYTSTMNQAKSQHRAFARQPYGSMLHKRPIKSKHEQGCRICNHMLRRTSASQVVKPHPLSAHPLRILPTRLLIILHPKLSMVGWQSTTRRTIEINAASKHLFCLQTNPAQPTPFVNQRVRTSQ
ncbi:unnamed protein product [Ectocarpus sp. 12 AP-2014]